MRRRIGDKTRGSIAAIAVTVLFSLPLGAGIIPSAAAQSATPLATKKPEKKPAQRSRKEIPSSGSLSELHSISELRTLFERDNGKVRLIALLSPT